MENKNMFAKKNLIKNLGFLPKENSADIFQKKYSGDYILEIDFEKQKIKYGDKIKLESETTSNFSQAENFVVLECVDRLLEKGYKPEDITLEKTWKLGHINKGRLDILVKKDGKAFLMIECKTWGAEFEKEFKNLQKDGGQLFSYFQQDSDADFLMLYASKFDETNSKIEFKNEIVVIEDTYRETSNIKDLHERWNKFSKDNGIFEDWASPYCFESKSLRLADLKNIKQEDSSFIFNRFLEILRHNAVSDKPNAFNKIFTLFLCKVKDEDKNLNDEVEFQWKEGEDDHVSFQKRLSDLYRKAMKEFLEKEVSDFSDEDFDQKYKHLNPKDKESLKLEITKLRLQKNNEFAIKDVFDEETFWENGIVLKEVVELLQSYKFRYNKKQPFLGDFFELLLTTGLKQETGQFFTPVPIARFICKSVPLKKRTEEKLKKGEANELLPNIIDYAAGSGHFLTESMEELQNIIDIVNFENYNPSVKGDIQIWRTKPFDWAIKYIYGIERDYRLVKTTKVGCYLHGDGVANVIHGDGLDDFESKKYREKLRKKTGKDNAQFDFVLSNPPYSVSAFKGNTKATKETSDLYDSLTDQSSEIETLFIERTKQLLKENGIAALVLPSSILSNSGIYTKAREILFKYFEFVAITELGSNTFMATGTNTVILFLKRRNDYLFKNISASVDGVFQNLQDVTINGAEKAFSKYLSHIWEGITFEDYKTLLEKNPNTNIQKHEIFEEYEKKFENKSKSAKWTIILELEKEKITYFLLCHSQKVVLVKTGEKKEEKAFLGYEFSNRRGNEGIHPTQREKSIDECTKLFDPEVSDNPDKASTYILDAFEENPEKEIPEELKKNISRVNLVDMMNFDRVDFEKTISLSVKKKTNYEEVWGSKNLVLLGKIADIKKGTSITSAKIKDGNIPVVAGGQKPAYFHNKSNRNGNIITISASGAYSGFVNYFSEPIFASDCNTILSKNEERISTKLIFEFLKNIQIKIYELQRGQAQPHVYGDDLANIKIPLPPKNIQQKIVDEIRVLEKKEKRAEERVIKKRNEIEEIIKKSEKSTKKKLNSFLTLEYGRGLHGSDRISGDFPVIGSNGIVGWHNEYLVKGPSIIIGRKGSVGKVNWIEKNNFPIDTTFYVHILNSSADLKFLYYSLKKLGLDKLAIGTGVPGLSRDDVYDLEFGLPSLPEQQKIVSEIEKIETKIETLEKELAEIPKQKAEILKKYL